MTNIHVLSGSHRWIWNVMFSHAERLCCSKPVKTTKEIYLTAHSESKAFKKNLKQARYFLITVLSLAAMEQIKHKKNHP